jgi:hypothetical protein
MVSINVYFPVVCLVLPSRLDNRSKPHEFTVNSILFWTARFPRFGAGASWKGKLFFTIKLMIVEPD